MANDQTKAERKAALKAAKKAEKDTKKAAIANGGNDKPAATQETKKEEVKPQVAAPTVTNKEEKKDPPKVDKPAKQPAKKEASKKDAPKAKKEPKIPTVIPEDGNDKVNQRAVERAANLMGVTGNGIPMGSTSSSLEGKAMLAHVMWEKYGKDQELAKRYPELYTDLMRNVDAVVLLGLVDARQDLINRGEKGEMNLLVSADQIMPLQGMAEMLGITLAPARALPGAGEEQLAIDFTESKVPEELSKDAGKTTEVIPELDHEKITTKEELLAALSYLISKEKNVAANIVNTVEWYRAHSLIKAVSADDKLAIDDKSTADLINEIFTMIKPVSLMQGLGRSVYLYTSQTGSPCMSHSLLHHHMSGMGWSEEQIASALKALITENFRYNLEKDDKLEASKDKALKALTGIIGGDYIDKLFADFNISTEGVEDSSKKNDLEAALKSARMIIGSIRTNYFPKDHTPTLDELRMKVGQIINLYRNPLERLAEYEQASITGPVEKEFPTKEKSEKKN